MATQPDDPRTGILTAFTNFLFGGNAPPTPPATPPQPDATVLPPPIAQSTPAATAPAPTPDPAPPQAPPPPETPAPTPTPPRDEQGRFTAQPQVAAPTYTAEQVAAMLAAVQGGQAAAAPVANPPAPAPTPPVAGAFITPPGDGQPVTAENIHLLPYEQSKDYWSDPDKLASLGLNSPLLWR